MRLFKHIKDRLRNEDGVITTELVLCMPVLIIFLSYMVCFAQLFYARQIALTAADIGARIAITQTSGTAAQREAEKAAMAYIAASGMGITYKEDTMRYDSWKRGNICDYTVAVEIKTAMPMAMDGGFAKTQYVDATAHMMIERERD